MFAKAFSTVSRNLWTPKLMISAIRSNAYGAPYGTPYGVSGQNPVPKLALLQLRNYAAVGAKIIPEKEDRGFIDLNTEKLCTHVCINYFIDGGEDPMILPDSEYPSWLFELKLERRKELEDLDPDIDGWLYWRAYRLRQLRQTHRIERLKYKFLNLQDSPTLRRSGYRGNKSSLYEM